MKCLIFAGILLGIYHTCSGNQCDLTIQKDGQELQDGEYVIGLGGQINQIYCKALCSGSGPTPALKWYKTPSNRPVRMFRGRMHQVRTTFDRVNILTIRNMLYSDIGIYKCKGWLKDQGWVEKSFELTYGCRGLDHQCDTSTCLRHTYVCNGHVDCQDGTDEQNCTGECKANQYHCHNGDCIDGSYVCDGYNDCIDASDELNCAGECKANQYHCHNGDCIDGSYVCDGYNDCIDASDELNCGCYDKFQCGDGTCIEMSMVCDSNVDCIDDEADELNCNRLSIWSRLLGNGGFRFNQRASTRFPTYNTKTTSGNSANNWIQKLQNMYNNVLRQLLGNNMATTTTTTLAPPTVGVKTSKTTNNPWLNSLRNLYTMAVWNQFLSNQTGSNKNAK